MKRVLLGLAAVAAGAALTGCMFGPDFLRPEPPATDGYLPEPLKNELVAANVPGGETQRFVQGMDLPGQWWTMFQSRPLNNLIETALKANPDIEAAIAGLKVAQQTARAQRASFFPTVQGGGSGTHNQIPSSLQSPEATGASIFGLFTAALSISYAPDVWGGTRRAVESLDAQAEAACFQVEAAYLTLASNVVVAAITEASLRGQIQAAERLIALQRDTLGLLQRQTGLGQIAGADVATQQAALAQTEASLPPLQKQLAQQRNLLATLLGRLPSNAPGERFDLGSLVLPTELPLSLPSKLVEQRPDIRAAEANLHSAAAQVGVAIANQFPQIQLNANVGTQAIALGSLFGPGLTGSLIGASFLQTLLDGGALLAKKRAAQAALQQADAQYRSAVLNAFRNVADTLRALEFDALALRAASNAERAAAISLGIARRRLELGDVGYLTVLTAELLYQNAQINLVQAQANRLSDTAALFQALGGGWWNRDDITVDGKTGADRCKTPTSPQPVATKS
jgi:NodT family efflux transporter outer membrane factor (OMF) lipoprotein